MIIDYWMVIIDEYYWYDYYDMIDMIMIIDMIIDIWWLLIGDYLIMLVYWHLLTIWIWMPSDPFSHDIDENWAQFKQAITNAINRNIPKQRFI